MSDPVLLADRISTSIALGESHFREFKSGLQGPEGAKVGRPPKEIAKDICSTLVGFANADGGTLLVGVEDDGRITGLGCSSDQLKYLKECWRDGIHKDTPMNGVQVNETLIEQNKILYFSTLKSSSHVHLTSDGRCLQRRDLETVPISVEEIHYTRAERASQEYDRQYVDGASAADLDGELIDALASQISKGMSREKCLQHLGLADFVDVDLRLRRAAVLLFATDINRWHPRIQIRVMRVSGNEVQTGTNYNVAADDYVQGNILQLIEQSWDKLRPHLVQTKISGMAKFETRVMYPELACREALINAIAHRDYSQEGRSIEIYIYDDRLEVKSPGALLSSISVADLKALNGAHQSRNTFIARVLRELGYMREVGEGVRRIFELMRTNDLEEPNIKSDFTSFSVELSNKTLYAPQHVLWLENFLQFDLSREEKAVVVLGYDGKLITPNDIWDGLGIVDTEHYRKIIASLQKKGIIWTEITKDQAQKSAKKTKINVRDVPRFQIVIPTIEELERRAKKKVSHAISNQLENYNENATLHMSNIPRGLTRAEMLDTFRSHGYNVDIRWPSSRANRPSYAFLQFNTEDEATKALAALDGLELGGRTLVVRKANPLPEKPGL